MGGRAGLDGLLGAVRVQRVKMWCSDVCMVRNSHLPIRYCSEASQFSRRTSRIRGLKRFENARESQRSIQNVLSTMSETHTPSKTCRDVRHTSLLFH